jgi:hypothetical protein
MPNSQTRFKELIVVFLLFEKLFHLGCSVKRGSPFLVVNGKYLLFIAIIMDNYIQSLKSQFRLFPCAFSLIAPRLGLVFLIISVDTVRCTVLLISAFQADAVFHFFHFSTRQPFHCFSFRPFVPSSFHPLSMYLVPVLLPTQTELKGKKKTVNKNFAYGYYYIYTNV